MSLRPLLNGMPTCLVCHSVAHLWLTLCSIGEVLGGFEDTSVSFDEAQKVLHYFTHHLDTDGDGLINRSEFCHAVSTELWAGMLVRCAALS